MMGRFNERILQDREFEALKDQLECVYSEALDQVDSLTLQKNQAYRERDLCVSLIARMALALGLTAGLGKHPEEDKDWETDWRNIVYIDLPSGQVSWHFHDSELRFFDFLPKYPGEYDGHSTPQKYKRVREPGELGKNE